MPQNPILIIKAPTVTLQMDRFCQGIGGIYLRKFVDDIDTDLPDPSSPQLLIRFQGLGFRDDDFKVLEVRIDADYSPRLCIWHEGSLISGRAVLGPGHAPNQTQTLAYTVLVVVGR